MGVALSVVKSLFLWLLLCSNRSKDALPTLLHAVGIDSADLVLPLI